MTAGLFLAMLVLVAFALIPRRLWYVGLPAVLGWVVVWFDGRWTAHWWDFLGAAATAAALVSLLPHRSNERTPGNDRPRWRKGT